MTPGRGRKPPARARGPGKDQRPGEGHLGGHTALTACGGPGLRAQCPLSDPPHCSAISFSGSIKRGAVRARDRQGQEYKQKGGGTQGYVGKGLGNPRDRIGTGCARYRTRAHTPQHARFHLCLAALLGFSHRTQPSGTVPRSSRGLGEGEEPPPCLRKQQAIPRRGLVHLTWLTSFDLKG